MYRVIYVRRRRFYRCRSTAVFRIICAFILFFICFLLLDAKLRPSVCELAAIEAHRVATEIINTAVEELLTQEALSYNDIVSVSYADNNCVTGITTDVMKLNLFKTGITSAVDEEFRKSKKTDIPVSLGTASGLVFLSGYGPYVDVAVSMNSSTVSDFENIFVSAGVNQTQHSVILNITSTVVLSLAGKRVEKTVETSFCVAQTVIVGSVPDVMVRQ